MALLLFVLIVSVGALQDAPTPIRWSAQQPTSAVAAGDIASVQVTALIEDGWHLYALDPVEGGPIPTQIAAGPAPAFTLLEKEIEKPEPKRSHDPNFGVETAYYDGSATFGLPIKVAPDIQPGTREIDVTARFQACNDQFCLRPQTATMKVSVQIRKRE